MSASEWVNATLEEFVCIAHQNLHLQMEQLEPPLRLRGRLLQLTLDCALCILKQPTHALALRAQRYPTSRISHAEVPSLAREWRHLIHRSWHPFPSFRFLPHLHMKPTCWPNIADPQPGLRRIHGLWLELIRSIVALKSTPSHSISWWWQVLFNTRCLNCSNSRCNRIEELAQLILIEACMEWGCYSRHAPLDPPKPHHVVAGATNFNLSKLSFSLHVLLECLWSNGWNGIFGWLPIAQINATEVWSRDLVNKQPQKMVSSSSSSVGTNWKINCKNGTKVQPPWETNANQGEIKK